MSEDQLDLSEFIAFWRHPIRYFYRNILDVKLELSSHEIDDNEVFAHDGLVQYQMLQKAVDQNLDSSDDISLEVKDTSELRSGAYPNKQWGHLLLDKYQEQASNMIESVKQLLGDSLTLKTLKVDLECDTESGLGEAEQVGLRLLGSMPLYCPADINSYSSVIMRHGEVRSVDKLTTWLTHLIKSANHNTGYTFIIDKKSKVGWFEPLEVDKAKMYLRPWLQSFNNYKSSLLRWHIDLAITYTQSLSDGLNPSQIQHALSKHFEPLQRGRNLFNDEYVKNAITSLNDLPNGFTELSELLCGPLLQGFNFETMAKAKKKLNLIDGSIGGRK